VKYVIITKEVIRYHGNRLSQERGDSNCSLHHFETHTLYQKEEEEEEEEKEKE